MYLVDTNVISETTRRCPSGAVLQWLGRQKRVHLSALSVLELEHGIARLPASPRRDLLREWFEELLSSMAVEVVPVDAAVAREAGRMKARCEAGGRPRPLADLLIAATAQVTGDVVVTRNTPDFDGLGVALLNPF
jgi:toxin FitB